MEHDKVRSELPGERLAYEEEDEEPLPSHDVKVFQALIARANYLAQDRSDIQFSVKELARSMSAPTRGAWKGLVKLGKYLKGHSRSGYLYAYQEKPKDLTIWIRIMQDVNGLESLPVEVLLCGDHTLSNLGVKHRR